MVCVQANALTIHNKSRRQVLAQYKARDVVGFVFDVLWVGGSWLKKKQATVTSASPTDCQKERRDQSKNFGISFSPSIEAKENPLNSTSALKMSQLVVSLRYLYLSPITTLSILLHPFLHGIRLMHRENSHLNSHEPTELVKKGNGRKGNPLNETASGAQPSHARLEIVQQVRGQEATRPLRNEEDHPVHHSTNDH